MAISRHIMNMEGPVIHAECAFDDSSMQVGPVSDKRTPVKAVYIGVRAAYRQWPGNNGGKRVAHRSESCYNDCSHRATDLSYQDGSFQQLRGLITLLFGKGSNWRRA